jgi:flagellar hook protein FlgE
MPLTLTVTKSGSNAWNWSAVVEDASTGTDTTVGTGTLAFNPDGSLNAATGNTITITPAGGSAPMTVTLDFGTPSATVPGSYSGIMQSAGNANVSARDQDGYGAGTLIQVSVDAGGRILGNFSNGKLQTIGQVMLAQFSNPSSLLHEGQNLYQVSGNTGIPVIFDPGNSTIIVSGSLEQSNVDLAEEFTRMITAQRGFQANARVITTSDEFLQELVNLKR